MTSFNVVPNQSEIVFDNVSFEYLKGKNIVHDLSFTIPSGKKVAIVGGSGSGLVFITTIMNRVF